MDNALLLEQLTAYNISTPNDINAQYCAELYTILERNYPCMIKGVCMPYNDFTVVLFFVIVLLIALGAGYWLRGKVQHEKNN